MEKGLSYICRGQSTHLLRVIVAKPLFDVLVIVCRCEAVMGESCEGGRGGGRGGGGMQHLHEGVLYCSRLQVCSLVL